MKSAIDGIIKNNLHSTMYLLNLKEYYGLATKGIDLHSTMYLLNHDVTDAHSGRTQFTFHYVSIKSRQRTVKQQIDEYLHSTMYLLNRRWDSSYLSLKPHLHSTMYL